MSLSVTRGFLRFGSPVRLRWWSAFSSDCAALRGGRSFELLLSVYTMLYISSPKSNPSMPDRRFFGADRGATLGDDTRRDTLLLLSMPSSISTGAGAPLTTGVDIAVVDISSMSIFCFASSVMPACVTV